MNQGFVLDGFPETFEQAKSIFSGRFGSLFQFVNVSDIQVMVDALVQGNWTGEPATLQVQLPWT